MKNLIVLMAVIVFISCKHEERQPLNIINLLDLSDSRDSSVTHWYRNTVVGTVLGNLGETSTFTAIPVDHGSLTSFAELYRCDFSQNNYDNEFAGLQADELAAMHHKDSLKSAGRQFATCFNNACADRKEFSNGTDIIGALKVAKTYYRPGSRNIIIVMADMLQCVPEQHIDFEKKLNNDKDVDSFLTKTDTIDLSGFEIIVLTGRQEKTNIIKYSAVALFWAKYFRTCNAHLISYSSGAVSQVAEILKDKK